MNTKKTIVAVLVSFLISNILATLWYSIMDDANFVAFRREEMNYLGLMLNHLVFAGLFVHFFPSYYSSSPGTGRSLIYGTLMAALMFLPSGMVVRSIWTVDFNSIFFLNTLAHMVIGAIMGFVLMKIYLFKK
ncbi:MAG: hypothetical protein JJ975_03555 [Bacteroidia bacterium]|nr:hypothetical protein [Bacteroidia bacterium]